MHYTKTGKQKSTSCTVHHKHFETKLDILMSTFETKNEIRINESTNMQKAQDLNSLDSTKTSVEIQSL